MELFLNDNGFEFDLLDVNELHDGIQYVYKFNNDYGASVVKRNGSYGHENDLWELAVIQFYKDGETIRWGITYETSITDNVIGYLTDREVQDLLSRIKEL